MSLLSTIQIPLNFKKVTSPTLNPQQEGKDIHEILHDMNMCNQDTLYTYQSLDPTCSLEV